MDSSTTIFYTTAQVKEMVELSDQNVRKYVRLLEDRNYDVTKDEHNRRLFSGDDITVLRELIRLAKQPGFTLESAADEIVRQVPTIKADGEVSTPVVSNNGEFTELLNAVVEKLDEMKNEHVALKDKMDTLIQKLEANESLQLRLNEAERTEDTRVGEDMVTPVESTDDSTEIDEATVTSAEEKEHNASSTEQLPDGVFEAEKRRNETRIDMRQYAPKQEQTHESDVDEKRHEEPNGDVNTETPPDESSTESKKPQGAFGKLVSFFKGKS